MKNQVITHEVIFDATPHEVFESLMDSKKHTQYTERIAKIQRKVGGGFTINDGWLSGKTIQLKKDRLIVQDWREKPWPKNYFSRVMFKLKPLSGGRRTQLSLIHSGVPEERRDEINEGWRKYYWEPMTLYLRKEKAKIVATFMEEFKNKHNLNIVYKLFTKKCKFHLVGNPSTDRKGQIEIGKKIFAAFPDVHVSLQDLIIDGDKVVKRHIARATHKGEFYGYPPTGKNVHWTENHIYRLENGKIAEVWSEASFHDLIKQVSS